MKNKVLILDNDNDNMTINYDKVAIVMALYYEESAESYFSYLVTIPKEIRVFVISSNEIILKKAVVLKKIYENLEVLKKENRGRDLSALLVAFKPYREEYDYFCFLHDKKSKHQMGEDDLILWTDNLWGNMICTKGYIRRAIELLRDENFGLLLPPKPIGIYLDSMYTDPWDNDFHNVLQLAHKICLNYEIRKEDRELVSLGSVFWCRTKALDKLFTYRWKYTDFPKEPMPNDGTISHAIERIFAFVAVDAGYKIGTIVNIGYASKMIMLLQDKLSYTYQWLWDNLGIKNTYQLSKYFKEKENIAKIFAQDLVYLYGAGDYGIQYLEKLRTWGYEPSGFVVSDGHKKCNELCDLPVREFSEIKKEEGISLIVATDIALQEEIANSLEEQGFFNYYKAICK